MRCDKFERFELVVNNIILVHARVARVHNESNVLCEWFSKVLTPKEINV